MYAPSPSYAPVQVSEWQRTKIVLPYLAQFFTNILTCTHTHTALGAAVTADKFPLVHDYISRMLQDAAVKKTALPPEKHLAFYKKMKESDGQHDYSVADLEGKGVTIYTKKQA